MVVAKPSLALVVGGGEGADLPRRADLVVSEIFGDDPLAEGVRADACSLVITPTLLDARDTLRHASMTFPGHHPSSTPPQPLLNPSALRGAIETLRHARSALLAPGTGVMIPEALKLLCAVAAVPTADAQARQLSLFD